jgi:prepilin-type N-terminal cleavage/methylation domain-containing protein
MIQPRETGLRSPGAGRGFTLIELLVGSTLMLVVIIAALSVYSKSNKVAVDQQQYAEVQHDVRTSMFLISRDVRMAGGGLPQEFFSYALEGVDNEIVSGALVTSDRLRILGNIDDPLALKIHGYQGSSVTLDLEDYSFEQYPYPDDYYVNKFAIILPNPTSACRAAEVRVLTHVTHSTGGTTQKLNMSPGLAPGVNPPGGLSGTCTDPNNYNGGLVLFADVREYWLDPTGNYPSLTAGVNGYVGGGAGGVLYMTKNGVHYPLAQDIENLQFEYNGDLDDNGTMDGFQPWQSSWTNNLTLIGRIRQIRILVLGCTPNRFVGVSGRPPTDIFNYRRPSLSNTPAASTNDMRRRFLLESTSNIRNLSLSIYNTGER